MSKGKFKDRAYNNKLNMNDSWHVHTVFMIEEWIGHCRNVSLRRLVVLAHHEGLCNK